MTVFVDTPGICAVLDADDRHNGEADHLWKRLVLETEQLVCTNYVLIESFALVQRRLGMHAARSLNACCQIIRGRHLAFGPGSLG